MRQRSVHPPSSVSVTAGTDMRVDELAQLLPVGWPQQVPLVRVSICGLLTIEVLRDVRTTASGQLELVYRPPDEEQMQRKGSSTALTLLRLLASQPGRFAAKDWLTEKLRRSGVGDSESEQEDEEDWSGLARLDNVVSLLRGILCPPGMPGASHLRKLLVVRVPSSPESGGGYRLAAEPLIWLDVEAIGMHVTRACELETAGQDALVEWKTVYQLGMRGLVLVEEPYSDWVQHRREEVEGYLWQSVQALWRRSVARQEAGGEEEALRLLRQYWLRHVEHEDALLPLLELLGKRGDYQRAEKYYAKLCAALTEEGREPGQRIQETMAFLRASQSQHEPTDHLFTTSSTFQRHPLMVDAIPLSSDETKRETAILSNTNASSLPLFAETRHLIGREEWLATVGRMVQAPLPKKLIVLHGPIGVGKSSELNRLATHFMSLDHDACQVIWIPVFSAESIRGPEAALDVFLGTLLSECAMAPFPPEAPRQKLIASVLASLEQRKHSIVIMLDNAECLLAEDGLLAPCWDLFLTPFLRSQHQATIMLATKEWRGWSGRDGVFVAEVPVPPLTQQDSIILLQRLGLETVPTEHLHALSKRVAGIPLGLEWLAQFVHDPLVFDDWQGLDDQVEASTPGRFDDMAQRVLRLLKTPSLVGEHLATKLTPLLQHILDTHLSLEARGVLEKLAVAPIPLGKPALQVLCPRPGLLKELRDASLLVASANRAQLLPMVASTVRQPLSPEQIQEMEERVIEALMRWLDEGNISDREAGSVVTELAMLLLTHHYLLDAAQLFIRHSWLSFKLGTAPRMAHLAGQVMQQFDWYSSLETWCGGKLLHYFLTPFLGQTFHIQQRLDDYLTIREAIFAGKIVVQPNVVVAITHYIIGCAMDDLCFEKAWSELEAACHYLEAYQGSSVDLSASLLEKRALIKSIWCSYLEEQGHQQAASDMREQAGALFQQSVEMLESYHEPASLKRARLKKRQAYALNYLGYHLYRMGRSNEALQVLHQSLTLQEQGYGEIDGLPPCYGDLSQTLSALGRFREALYFDEKAYAEAQRLADAGHTSSQKEIWVYRINRGCLYLRLGRVNEAESLIREALPHIALHRRIYSMFGQEALAEIEQWRRSVVSPQHQLDWRWVERYRTLASFDSYWWLAPTGPFTDEEQLEWEQSFTRNMDEAMKAHLGTLMARSMRREVRAAMDEQREPLLRYPALDIEEVRTRIAGLLQLDALVLRDEPNAIVRRLYHETIEEELHFLYLIQATHEGINEQFWEQNVALNPLPTPEEMHYVFSRVKRYVLQSLLYPRAKEAGEQFLHICKQYGMTFDLSSPEEQALDQIVSFAPAQQQTHMVSVQAAKRFFEEVFQKTDFTGWQVAIDPNAESARVEQGLRCLFLANRSYSVKEVRQLLSHELAGHVARCMAGERSLLGLLGIHSKNSLETEEGLGMYYEILDVRREGGVYDETGLWLGTLATGLASGVLTPPQTFHALYRFFVAFITMYRLLVRPDQDSEAARSNARRIARERCLRTFRGVPQLAQAGICYTKDAHYLRGLRKVEKALQEDEHILDRLAVGVVALNRLPDLQELGIMSAPRPLRILAEDPHLDEYITSFEQEEGKEEKSL